MGVNENQAVINITSLEHFREIINGEKKSIIVDFWASWCSPCRIISPYFQKLAIQAPDNVKLYKVNIDDVMDLAKEFKIRAIPTFICFKDGKKTAEFTGADRAAVEALIYQASQDDYLEKEVGKRVAEITGADIVDDVPGLLSQLAQEDDLKMEKLFSEFKIRN